MSDADKPNEEPTAECVRYGDFETAALAELRVSFCWTDAQGLVESEGPLLVRRIWNRIVPDERMVD